jgi:hypothetical protein
MNKISKILALTTGAAVIALCTTAQAQTAVTGWGMLTGNAGGWTMNDLGSGSFDVGNGSAAPTGNTVWMAQFTPITLTVGESIELTGSFSFQGGTGSLGGANFRWGIDDLTGLGTLSSGTWSGSGTGKGYMWAIPTGGAGIGGGAPTEVTGHNGGGAWYSSNGGAYTTTTTSGGGNDNPSDAVANTYDFTLEYTLTSANVMTISGLFSDTSNAGSYSESGVWTDSGGDSGTVASDVFNTAGFFVSNSGTTADGFDFSDVDVQTIAAPEPATLALCGLGGLASAYFVRRRKA